ncbi:efflux RND transporter periplasmic adaptor subunit [Maritimibacter fusiformis]|uniref:Efflux RND transporter periplasmic adaptor subunit n=1 Tax=Maritimibacter fusiformis TaxID=2603819 RepID=A0A5D0RKN2_9RHOB|nr:efflux RND transporter periplasmic adaptor subunit [Maritimibacter fusiformis]TYB81074.1 efflux RND transporter periplasmic adaptor subunit [Maritimibacter fusiformis]
MADKRREIEATLGLSASRYKVSKWIYLLVALVVAGGGLYWWTSEAETRRAVTFETESVSRADLAVTVTATGTIEPTNLVEISSELSGTMKDVLVDFNDTVTAGQVLAQLDMTQLEAQLAVQTASHAMAQAQVASAEASLLEATLNYDTVKQLGDRGITTLANQTAAEAGLARARAALASANANLDLAQAQLEAQQAELAKACICSPINGMVLRRNVDEGQIVAAALSAPVLFTIAEDLTKMELHVDVSEADIGRIEPGDDATFRVDAYDEQSFPAVISMVRFAAETIDGLVTYKAILSIENEDLLLRPGMTATADIIVAKYSDVLVVPNAALRFAPPQVVEAAEEDEAGGGGLFGLLMPSRSDGDDRVRSERTVWVLRDGEAVEVPVERGDTDGRMTHILSGDIAEGDLVIVDLVEGG